MKSKKKSVLYFIVFNSDKRVGGLSPIRGSSSCWSDESTKNKVGYRDVAHLMDGA